MPHIRKAPQPLTSRQRELFGQNGWEVCPNCRALDIPWAKLERGQSIEGDFDGSCGRVTCPLCKGVGLLPPECPLCGGSGRIEYGPGKSGRCPLCKGKKRVRSGPEAEAEMHRSYAVLLGDNGN